MLDALLSRLSPSPPPTPLLLLHLTVLTAYAVPAEAYRANLLVDTLSMRISALLGVPYYHLVSTLFSPCSVATSRDAQSDQTVPRA